MRWTTFALILAGCGAVRSPALDDATTIGACGTERRCTRACDDGDTAACLDLGGVHEAGGRGDEAADAFDRGCAHGEIEACARQVATLRRLGREGEAAGVVRALCEAPGRVEAERCRELSAALGLGGGEPEAEQQLRRGCDAGDAVACRDLGRALQARGELERAEPLLSIACRQGDVDGCLGLAETLARLGRAAAAADARARARALGADEKGRPEADG